MLPFHVPRKMGSTWSGKIVFFQNISIIIFVAWPLNIRNRLLARPFYWSSVCSGAIVPKRECSFFGSHYLCLSVIEGYEDACIDEIFYRHHLNCLFVIVHFINIDSTTDIHLSLFKSFALIHVFRRPLILWFFFVSRAQEQTIRPTSQYLHHLSAQCECFPLPYSPYSSSISSMVTRFSSSAQSFRIRTPIFLDKSPIRL